MVRGRTFLQKEIELLSYSHDNLLNAFYGQRCFPFHFECPDGKLIITTQLYQIKRKRHTCYFEAKTKSHHRYK